MGGETLKELASKLTEKQKRFADYYIETGNATEAAFQAGYSPNSIGEIGSENLKKPLIKEYISTIIRYKDHDRIASQDEVLEYLTSVMRGEIKEEKLFVVSDSVERAMKEADIKDRNKAAELLGKRYRLFTDKIEVNAKEQVVIVDDFEEDEEE